MLLHFSGRFCDENTEGSMKLVDKEADQDMGKMMVQKQVKHKILQAQQEEALFVQTSTALQSKMEKVEQQLSHSSMNGYHIGHHLKAAASMQANATVVTTNGSAPKCPMDHLPQQQAQPSTPPTKKDDDIASAYFQAKYGAGTEEQAQQPALQNNFSQHRFVCKQRTLFP